LKGESRFLKSLSFIIAEGEVCQESRKDIPAEFPAGG